jgi:hypothetical protein
LSFAQKNIHLDPFKSIIGFLGVYEISSQGFVKSLKRKYQPKDVIMKSFNDKNGYSRIALGKKRCFVHRLVAVAFIPNPENKPEVNHINGVKSDNRVENLEWATRKENAIHSHETGLQITKYGEDRGKVSKLKKTQVIEIKKRLNEGEKWNHINEDYNVSSTTIYDIFKCKTWKNVKI